MMKFKSVQVSDLTVFYTKILLDTETPTSLYLKARKESPYSFLLESVEEGNNIGRFSIVGWGKVKEIKGYSDRVIMDGKEHPTQGLYDDLRHFMSGYCWDQDCLINGFFGYIGYESVYDIEPTISKYPLYGEQPVSCLFLPRVVAVFDKLSHEVQFVFNYLSSGDFADNEQILRKILAHEVESSYLEPMNNFNEDVSFRSNFIQKDFEEIVEKAKKYIVKGDIFQVVLSQKFNSDYTGDPFLVYRYLCSLNPSPYMFYFNFGDEFQLMGTSPEIMLKKIGDTLVLRPIAGTRPRGNVLEEDRDIEKELLDDAKENAEHLMLVDLARNDLNRVCYSDSVKVNSYKIIERYSHVMHIVSSVSGKMLKDHDIIKAIKAVFPAGTLSGAPKVRAMQIIRELENEPRQTYGGLVGYFDFNGNFDSCITIRSLCIKDGVAFFQAGAGIVADSVPELEYQESENKAKAMLKALSQLR